MSAGTGVARKARDFSRPRYSNCYEDVSMRIRIRLEIAAAPALKSARGSFAAVLAGLLPPAALVLLAMALWRLAADLRLATGFAVSNGVFSHWQAWAAGALLLQSVYWLLNRRSGHRFQSVSRTEAESPARRRPAPVRSGDL